MDDCLYIVNIHMMIIHMEIYFYMDDCSHVSIWFGDLKHEFYGCLFGDHPVGISTPHVAFADVTPTVTPTVTIAIAR